jgi:hypothetical protein
LVPPDDEEHECGFREYAKHLESKVDALRAEMEVLKRAFAKRSEKGKRMPKVPRAPRTAQEEADRRTEQALLRSERLVTEEKTARVPDEQKKCHLCGGTTFRSVGDIDRARVARVPRARAGHPMGGHPRLPRAHLRREPHDVPADYVSVESSLGRRKPSSARTGDRRCSAGTPPPVASRD